ncbi:MAG: DegV family protein [Vulcanimicrobiaceae bacterium]
MGVVVVTDSGCDLTRSEGLQAGIDIVPMYVVFGGQRLRDGVDIDRATFFAKFKGEQPGTEPPATRDYSEAFARHLNAGNDVLCISMSSQISQAFAHAQEAAAGLGTRVHVVDSRGSSGLEVLLALRAADLAKQGLGAQEIATHIDPRRLKAIVYFAVPEITSLGRSGRLPKPIVALGSMLGVSLVLKINEDGVIGLAGQSRSFDKTCEILVDAVVRAIEHSSSVRVAISHVEAPDTAARLSRSLEAKLGYPPAYQTIHDATLTIATHLGLGAVAISAIVP